MSHKRIVGYRSLLLAICVFVVLGGMHGIIFSGSWDTKAIEQPVAAAMSPAYSDAKNIEKLAFSRASFPKNQILESQANRNEMTAEQGREKVLQHVVNIGDFTQQSLESLASYKRYQLCERQQGANCQADLTDALYQAMALYVKPAIAEGTLTVKMLRSIAAEDIYAAVGDVLEHSANPVERVSALLLLEFLPNVSPLPLPRGAYYDLAAKSAVEVQLLLHRNKHTPIPYADIVYDVMYLVRAEATDPRVQAAAIEALGHPESAEALLGAVHLLRTVQAPDWDGWFNSVAPALGRCARACVQHTRRLLQVVENPQRVALTILEMAPAHERGPLLAELQSLLPSAFVAQVQHEIH